MIHEPPSIMHTCRECYARCLHRVGNDRLQCRNCNHKSSRLSGRNIIIGRLMAEHEEMAATILRLRERVAELEANNDI